MEEKIKKITKEEWVDMLIKLEAFCYIKPNMHKHESGFRCFEVGYLTVGDDNKMKEKLVLSKYSDHIQLYQYFDVKLEPNLDLLLDGYIRIYNIGSGENIWWGSMDYVLSSAQICPIGEKRVIFKEVSKLKQ